MNNQKTIFEKCDKHFVGLNSSQIEKLDLFSEPVRVRSICRL